jgi:hypothetical protein
LQPSVEGHGKVLPRESETFRHEQRDDEIDAEAERDDEADDGFEHGRLLQARVSALA